MSPFPVARGKEVTSDGFIIKWSQVEGAEYYIVEIRAADGFYKADKVRPLSLEDHVDRPTGLQHNTKHDITIKAFNKFTEGSEMTKSFYTRPMTPSRFRGVSVFDDEVSLTWDPVDGINKYDIHIYDDNNHLGHVVIQDETQHTFKELIPNHHYIFVIRAYGHIVSDPATTKIYTKIEGVDYLTMNEVYDDRMILDWKDADGARSYRVEFSFENTRGEKSEVRQEFC